MRGGGDVRRQKGQAESGVRGAWEGSALRRQDPPFDRLTARAAHSLCAFRKFEGPPAREDVAPPALLLRAFIATPRVSEDEVFEINAKPVRGFSRDDRDATRATPLGFPRRPARSSSQMTAPMDVRKPVVATRTLSESRSKRGGKRQRNVGKKNAVEKEEACTRSTNVRPAWESGPVFAQARHAKRLQIRWRQTVSAGRALGCAVGSGGAPRERNACARTHGSGWEEWGSGACGLRHVIRRAPRKCAHSGRYVYAQRLHAPALISGVRIRRTPTQHRSELSVGRGVRFE
jgi:hypothetical protein